MPFTDAIDPRLPVGVFDSGVGGLTVLKALAGLLPMEDFLYLGDTARLPYGAKSRESVVRYALQCTRRLLEMGVKGLVIACNTASAAALPALREAYPGLPVIGVVEPGARAACAVNASGNMAVIATEGTVRDGAYKTAILKLCPGMRVESQACTLFVALAEEGWTGGELVERIIEKHLAPLFARFAPKRPDSLVLGCTHFPVLAESLAAVAGPETAIIDSAVTTAAEVRDILRTRRLLHPERPKGETGTIRFFATDGAARFARVGGIFLGESIDPKTVDLVDL